MFSHIPILIVWYGSKAHDCGLQIRHFQAVISCGFRYVPRPSHASPAAVPLPRDYHPHTVADAADNRPRFRHWTAQWLVLKGTKTNVEDLAKGFTAAATAFGASMERLASQFDQLFYLNQRTGVIASQLRQGECRGRL
jgi:hypothetical protein